LAFPYLKIFGPAVVERGYRIVCIAPNDKAPVDDDWQSSNATAAQVRKWLSAGRQNYGVGIITERTPAVDIDCHDPDLVAEMATWVREEYGEAPVRVGHAPKTLLVFRSTEPFAKVMSASWVAPDAPIIRGKPARYRLEVLGRGQQFVAFGTHPDTGKSYKWTEGARPSDGEWQDLPELTVAAAQRIAAKFDQLAKAKGWTIAGKARVQGASDEWDANLAQRVRLTPEQCREMLMLIPNTDDASLDYDKWLEYGMACYHQFEGAPEGYDLWVEWSEQSFKFNIGECEKKWSSFDVDGKDRTPVTFRSILADAKHFKQIQIEEKLAGIKHGLATVQTRADWSRLIAEVKNSEFDTLIRNSLIPLVQKAYEAAYGAKMSTPDAKRHVKQSLVLTDRPVWLEHWVYDRANARFFNPRTSHASDSKGFDEQFNKYLLSTAEILDGKSVPDMRPTNVALNLFQIPQVDGVRYAPLEPAVFHRGAGVFANTYSDRNVPPVPKTWLPRHQEAADTFFAHIAHLFPDERDQGIAISWFAYIVQTRKRINWAILIQGCEGDGKTVLYRILNSILGDENTRVIDPKGFESEFNQFAEGALFACVDEIRFIGKSRYDIMDRIKPLITNARIPIRGLYQKPYMADNTCSYLLLTNHQDALPVTDEVSRYFVLKSRWASKKEVDRFKEENPDYYNRVWRLLDEPGAVRKALLDYKLHPEFIPDARAPESAGKAYMTSVTESEEYAVLMEIIRSNENRLVCDYFVSAHDAIDAIEESAGTRLDPQRMRWVFVNHGFTSLGAVRVRSKVGRERHTVWTLRPDAWPTEKTLRENALSAYLRDEDV
jgi:Primase C terminal 2 (PriCT-2)/Bifunctional DNA primase/polymerase, N-terminal/Family of unknown function (DUF5906)